MKSSGKWIKFLIAVAMVCPSPLHTEVFPSDSHSVWTLAPQTQMRSGRPTPARKKSALVLNPTRAKMFEQIDGIGLCPVLWTLYQTKVLEKIPGPEDQLISMEALAHRTGANRGYLGVVVRGLASQGWVRWEMRLLKGKNGQPGKEQRVLGLTDEGQIVLGILRENSTYREALKKSVSFLAHSMRMDAVLFGPSPETKASKAYAELLELSRRQWGLAEETDPMRARIRDQLIRHLDGLIIGPTAISLWENGILGPMDEKKGKLKLPDGFQVDSLRGNGNNLQTAFRFLEDQQWVRFDGQRFVPTDEGKKILSGIFANGVPVSYLPTLKILPRLLFSKVPPPMRTASGQEKYVNRPMNVRASGATHHDYFEKMKEEIRKIFDDPDLDAQPQGIMDTGCGDGKFLKQLYRFIRQETLRGKVMETSHPLRIAGVDFNEQALEQAQKTLSAAGIEHITLKGDIRKPAGIERALIKNAKAEEWGLDMKRLLHVRSFLDHNRPGGPIAQVKAGLSSTSTGGFAYRGREVSNAKLEADLVKHFKRWLPYVSRYGLLSPELHTIAPWVAARNRGNTLSVTYDIIHGLSDQYIVELEVYLRAARKAGLEPIFLKRVPHEERTTISLCRFVKAKKRYPKKVAGKETYHLPDGSVVVRITSPEYLPGEVRPYWDNHHALYVIWNRELGYRAYLGMHRVKAKDGVLRSIGGTDLEKHGRRKDTLSETLLLSKLKSHELALLPGQDVCGGKFVIDFDNASAKRRDVLDSAASALEWIATNLKEGIFTGQGVNISKGDVVFMQERAPSSTVGFLSTTGEKIREETPPVGMGTLRPPGVMPWEGRPIPSLDRALQHAIDSGQARRLTEAELRLLRTQFQNQVLASPRFGELLKELCEECNELFPADQRMRLKREITPGDLMDSLNRAWELAATGVDWWIVDHSAANTGRDHLGFHSEPSDNLLTDEGEDASNLPILVRRLILGGKTALCMTDKFFEGFADSSPGLESLNCLFFEVFLHDLLEYGTVRGPLGISDERAHAFAGLVARIVAAASEKPVSYDEWVIRDFTTTQLAARLGFRPGRRAHEFRTLALQELLRRAGDPDAYALMAKALLKFYFTDRPSEPAALISHGLLVEEIITFVGNARKQTLAMDQSDPSTRQDFEITVSVAVAALSVLQELAEALVGQIQPFGLKGHPRLKKKRGPIQETALKYLVRMVATGAMDLGNLEGVFRPENKTASMTLINILLRGQAALPELPPAKAAQDLADEMVQNMDMRDIRPPLEQVPIRRAYALLRYLQDDAQPELIKLKSEGVDVRPLKIAWDRLRKAAHEARMTLHEPYVVFKGRGPQNRNVPVSELNPEDVQVLVTFLQEILAFPAALRKLFTRPQNLDGQLLRVDFTSKSM